MRLVSCIVVSLRAMGLEYNSVRCPLVKSKKKSINLGPTLIARVLGIADNLLPLFRDFVFMDAVGTVEIHMLLDSKSESEKVEKLESGIPKLITDKLACSLTKQLAFCVKESDCP